MSIWLVPLILVAACYVIGRLTSTADLPVSPRLARAREQLEHRFAKRADDASSRPRSRPRDR